MAISSLILGGARSGKSAFAQQLAEESGKDCLYIATAQAFDAEMAERIARHRMDRGPRWQTVEEPLAIADALRRHDRGGLVMLVDCLTLWLSNVLLAGRHPDEESRQLLQAASACAADTLFVSNEVGLGIVPETRLGREFRDHAGRLHQHLAARCDRVALMVAGLPLWIKQKPGSP